MRYFTDRNGPKQGLHENEIWNTKVFQHFEILKWMLQTLMKKKKENMRSFFGTLCWLQQQTKACQSNLHIASEISHHTLSENDIMEKIYE